MKTLKKTLCMVLAVVMVVGVLILPASAADATKAELQKDAYDTLTLYGIMHGRDGGAAALDENVRRDEVATIVYRIMTGDTSENGEKAGNFKAAAKNFTDVATTNWAAGFIGYTAESKIFSGREGNKFDPTANVRGDELVKVMLRCLGYGEEGEYTGDGWNTRALFTAQEIGMLDDVSEEMEQPLTRGAVAQIVLNAIELPMATYYNGTYSIYHDDSGRPSAPNSSAKLNPALVEYDDNKADTPDDDWTGVPYYEYVPTIKFNHTYGAETRKFDKVTEEVEPVGEYWTQTTLGDIAYEGGIRKAAGAKLEYWLNGADKGEVTATPASKDLVGAQGQWTRTYDLDEDGKIDRIVCLDILLAKVTKVNKETTAHGVVMTNATTELEVYTNASRQTTAAAAKDAETAVVVGSDYKKDDYVLIYAEQNASNALVEDANAEIIGAAPSIIGKQTTIYYNQNKHRIDNVDYNDNNRYTLDVATTNGGTFVWYQDLQGNIIGSVEKDEDVNLDYAVLTNLIWTVGNPGYAEGTLLYMNGATSKVRVNSIQAYQTSAWANNCVVTLKEGGVDSTIVNGDSKAYVSADPALNAVYQGSGLYEVSINDDGTVDLVGKPGSSDETTDVKYVAANTQIDPEKFEIVTSGTKVYADSSTVFIYKTTDSAGNVEFKRVVGIKNMPNLGTGTAALSFYYADITKDGDSIADYVYINDSAAAAKSGSQLIAALSHSYAAKPGTTAKYILERLWMGTGEVANDTVYADAAQLSSVIQTLATNAGKLYVATYDVSTKNKITAVAAIDADKGAKYSTNTWAANGSDLTAWGTDHFIVLARSGDSTAANNAKITHSADLTMISGLGKAGSAIATNYTETSKIKVYGAITKEELPDLDFSKYNVYVEVDKGDIVAVYVLDKVAAQGSGVTPGTTPTATSVIKEVSFNTIVQEIPGAYEDLEVALTNAVAVSKKAFNASEDEVTVKVTKLSTAPDNHVIKSYASLAAAKTATVDVSGDFADATLHISVGGYIVIGAEVSGTTTYYAYKIVE